MANNFKLSIQACNDLLDGYKAQYNSGYLRIYDGTQPTNPDTAIGGQVLLAELVFNATAFGAASNRVITAAAITGDASANNSGTASWFRLFKSNGTTVMADGTVGTSACDINFNSVAISSGATVNVTAFTITQPVP